MTHFGPVHGGRHWIAVAEVGVVVWQRDSGWTTTWAGTPQLDEDTMCGAATSRLRGCGGLHHRGLPGQYRVDVVEARTGRPVGSFPIEAGKARSGCGEHLLAPASEADTKGCKDYDLPESENLGTHLSPFVGGAPR